MSRNRRQEKEDLEELKEPLLDDGDRRGIDEWEPKSFSHSFDRLPGTPRLPFEKSRTQVCFAIYLFFVKIIS